MHAFLFHAVNNNLINLITAVWARLSFLLTEGESQSVSFLVPTQTGPTLQTKRAPAPCRVAPAHTKLLFFFDFMVK